MPVLAYPTLRQLERLAGYATVADAVAGCEAELPPATMTTIRFVDGVPAMEVADDDGTPRRYRGGPVGPDELAPGHPRAAGPGGDAGAVRGDGADGAGRPPEPPARR